MVRGRRRPAAARGYVDASLPDRIGPDVDLAGIRDEWSAEGCSMDRTLSVVGTRSSMLLIREAFYGTRRFQDFAQRVGISEAVAATRLRELVQHGLLEKVTYRREGERARQEYRLTDRGRDLLPAVLALMQWGDRWLADGQGPVQLQHEACGTPLRALVCCEEGHQVDIRQVRVRPGPGMLPAGSPEVGKP